MKEGEIKYKIGTLVIDSGRLGVIAAYYPRGSVDFGNAKQINWRDNYHLYFLKGKSYIMGTVAFERLVNKGTIKIIAEGIVGHEVHTTLLPPSPQKKSIT